MRFAYTERPEWPPLGWLAELRPGAETVRVRHGRKVETRPEWFCEAVWAGEFADGDFDRTDIVFGSGARLRAGRLAFVSSGSTLDRLQWLERGDRVWASNSLPCLIAAADARFDPVACHYFDFFLSAIHGLNAYRRAIATSAGALEVAYFHNLEWTGSRLARIDKPEGDRAFPDFESYRDFLDQCLARVAANMRARERGDRYRYIGTLSQGYDSPAAVALARHHGLAEAICFERAEPDHERGARIAPHLGVEPLVVPVDAWRDLDRPEPPFIAADGFGEEIHLAAAADLLAERVLVSGYCGGRTWNTRAAPPDPDLRRNDISGSALTEYRLRAGFLHLPLPCLGMRALVDLHRIGRSPELEPWDIGGGYTRPVARRIAEEGGVPRDLFGQKKRFASRWLLTSRRFLTDASAGDYRAWLEAHRREWWRRGRVPPPRSARIDRLELAALERIGRALVNMPGFFELGLDRVPLLRRLALARSADSKVTPITTHFRRFVVPWAVERAKLAYEAAAAGAAEAAGTRSQLPHHVASNGHLTRPRAMTAKEGEAPG